MREGNGGAGAVIEGAQALAGDFATGYGVDVSADRRSRGGEQVLGQRPSLEDRAWRLLAEGGEVGQEFGPRDVQERLQAILQAGALHGEPMAVGDEDPECEVRRGEKGEAYKRAIAHELADQVGILGVRLERTVVLELLRTLGVGGEDIDDRVPLLGEEVRKGVPVVGGELDPHQHVLAGNVWEELLEILVGGDETRS